MVHRAHLLMVLMDCSMMGMWNSCAHMFKLAVLICSPKSFISNSFSLWYTPMLKPLDVYMLATVLSSWMILSVLLELFFSDVRKVVLDDFL